MIVLLNCDQLLRIAGELEQAGGREIGGVLVGEHLEGETFRIVDFSVQRSGGGRAHFRRDPVKAARFVEDVIVRSGGDCERINYLGEWHSHPSCAAVPSGVDIAQMCRIVDDPDRIAHFSVLMVVGLLKSTLQLSLTLFRPGEAPEPVQISFEAGAKAEVLEGPMDASEEQTDDDLAELAVAATADPIGRPDQPRSAGEEV